jgi:hypothetical protein
MNNPTIDNYTNSGICKLIRKSGEGSYVSHASRTSVIKYSKHARA